MNSLQRVLTSLGQSEPDYVPFFLLPTLHGAKELGLSIEKYFSEAENVAEGQLRLRARYHHDCLYNFFYAPIEVEAWGAEIIFSPDGPPNSGQPFLANPEDIQKLHVPSIEETPCLSKVLKATRLLKQAAGDEVPIIGVAVSPFSLPVMQLGFDKYFDVMLSRPDLFERLMQVNEEFCVAWANAQLTAGATAICYFDPVSSSTIIPPALYRQTGYEIARRTLARIHGPTATHLASGRCLPILDDLAQTGTAIVGVSALEDLAELKTVVCAAGRSRLSLLGNLNGIEMRRWTPRQAEAQVKAAIAKAGRGGGFILCDNHGEIPWQVPDQILMAISDAVHQWGAYPLKWIENDQE